MSRTLVRTLLGGGAATVAVPLALATAARIQERDWHAFLGDPTQLANGIRDLADSAAPDGVPVCSDVVLVEEGALTGSLGKGAHATAALEATARLRQSLGDRIALVAVLPGPSRVATALDLAAASAVEMVLDLGRAFLAAGADVVLVRDEGEHVGDLGTLANIARFHQALALSYAEPSGGLPLVTRAALDGASQCSGVVVTDGDVERHVDFTLLEDWIDEVKG